MKEHPLAPATGLALVAYIYCMLSICLISLHSERPVKSVKLHYKHSVELRAPFEQQLTVQSAISLSKMNHHKPPKRAKWGVARMNVSNTPPRKPNRKPKPNPRYFRNHVLPTTPHEVMNIVEEVLGEGISDMYTKSGSLTRIPLSMSSALQQHSPSLSATYSSVHSIHNSSSEASRISNSSDEECAIEKLIVGDRTQTKKSFLSLGKVYACTSSQRSVDKFYEIDTDSIFLFIEDDNSGQIIAETSGARVKYP